MKQTLAMLFVTALLLFSLAGCGEKKDSNTANGPSTGTTEYDAQRRPPQCRRERQRPQPLFWQRQDHHARKRQPLR